MGSRRDRAGSSLKCGTAQSVRCRPNGNHYSHVTQVDRMSIQAMMQAQLDGPEIARRLGFIRSTMNREINRSKILPTAAAAADYQADVAQDRSV